MQDNYFFDYLMKNPTTVQQTRESTVAFLQDCVRNGKKNIYSALRKDSTNCRSLTYQDLAEYSQDIYKTLYPFLSEKHPGHYESPDKLSADDCFNLAFTTEYSIIGFHMQDGDVLAEINDENRHNFAGYNFIHFEPNGRTKPTNSDVDDRDISKRIYLNVSPENALNVVREVAQYISDTKSSIYCKFYARNDRSDPFLIYTNEEHLPEMMHFLDSLEKNHPEYLAPADCKMPFYASVRSYCGIADEPKYAHSSFNREASDAFYGPIQRIQDEIMSELNITEKSYYAEVYGQTLDAQNFSLYTAWLKVGQTIYNQKDRFSSPKNEKQANAKAYYDEMWEQYLSARKNPDSPLANKINELGQDLYESMQQGKPCTSNLSIKTHTQHKNPYGIKANFYAESQEQKFQQTGKYEESLTVDLNFYKEVFTALDGEKLLQEKLSLDNFEEVFGDSLREHHLSPDYIFMNTETAEKFEEYQAQRSGSDLDKSASPTMPQEIARLGPGYCDNGGGSHIPENSSQAHSENDAQLSRQ